MPGANTTDPAAGEGRKFRKKPVVIEALTFDELVAYGLANGANVVNGMPWSFKFRGHPITHENDDCYLIPTLEGTMKMTRTDMLIVGVKGEIYPCKADIFAATYEPAESPAPQTPAPDATARATFDAYHKMSQERDRAIGALLCAAWQGCLTFDRARELLGMTTIQLRAEANRIFAEEKP